MHTESSRLKPLQQSISYACRLSVCVSLAMYDQSVSQSVSLSVCQSVCLSVCLSVRFSVVRLPLVTVNKNA